MLEGSFQQHCKCIVRSPRRVRKCFHQSTLNGLDFWIAQDFSEAFQASIGRGLDLRVRIVNNTCELRDDGGKRKGELPWCTKCHGPGGVSEELLRKPTQGARLTPSLFAIASR